MPSTARMLWRAIELAAQGAGHVRPNPPVGAVIVDNSGRIIGEGFHHRAGCAHAEVEAIAAVAGSARGATIYVTLEPCSRPGRVGACTDAIIAAGISKVVYLIEDPNPVNRGKAALALGQAGVQCFHYPNGCADATDAAEVAALTAAGERLIRAFRKHVVTKLPYVTVKLAMSLDGRICDSNGDARWVSSAAARRETGTLREHVDAIMVGGETVRRDDPVLLPHDGENNDLVRVVISASGNLPPNAKVFTVGPNPTLVFDNPRQALERLGADGITHVLCEGGMRLAVSMAEAGLVDEWLTVLAPKIIGTRPINSAIEGKNSPEIAFFGGDAFIRTEFK